MLKKIKRSVAVLLVVTMLVTMFTIAPNAAELNKPNASSSTTEYSVTGNNDLGDILAEEILEYQAMKNQGDGSYVISNITMDGNVATVEYSAASNCIVLVAVYDENTDVMLASGKVEASVNNSSVIVPLETDNMPTAFIVKGFIIGNNNEPLSQAYCTEMYTTEMQALMKATVNDFEPDEVLNIDDNPTTNFMVYSDSVKKFECSDSTNTIQTADDANSTYVFENADNNLKSLNKGDIFVCDDNPENPVIIKVGDIKVDGDTVTLTSTDTSLEEVFECVKVDSGASLADAKVDENTGSRGITYLGSGKMNDETVNKKDVSSVGAAYDDSSVGAIEINSDIEYDHKFEFGNDGIKNEDGSENDDDEGWLSIKGEIDGSVGVNGKAEVKIYIAVGGRKEISLTLTASLYYKSSLQGSVNIEPKLPRFEIPLAGDALSLALTAGFFIEASGNFEIAFEITSTVGFSYSDEGGFNNLSEKPKTDYSMDLEAEVYVGFSLDIEAIVFDDKIGEVGYSGKIGLDITASPTSYNMDIDGVTLEHECKKCVSGDIKLKIELTPIVKVLNEDVFEKVLPDFDISKTLEWPLTPWYYSFDNGGSFGLSLCKNASCSFYVKVVDKNGNPVENADVDDFANGVPLGTTGSLGLVQVTLKGNDTGFYQIHAAKGSETAVVGLSIEDFEKISVHENAGGWIEITDSSNFNNGCYTIKIGKNKPDPTTDPTSTNPTSTNPTSTDPSSTNPLPTEPEPTEPPEPVILDSGKCGENITWEFWSDGNLYLDGYGAMYNYGGYVNIAKYFNPSSGIYYQAQLLSTSTADVPWKDYIKQIKYVDISNKVTSIGDSAFAGCVNLIDINLPYRLTRIGDAAFYNCKSLECSIWPSSTLRYIGDAAFYECEKLEYANISDTSLTYLGRFAFAECPNLEYCVLPKSNLEKISDGLFYKCYSLHDFDIPKSVEYIGKVAFYKCGYYCVSINAPCKPYCGAKDVSIPENVSYIGEYAFLYSGAGSFYVDSNNINYTSIDGVLYDKEVTKIISYPRCSEATYYAVPESITEINSYEFMYCTNLKNVVISANVASMGEGAFYSCKKLEEVTIDGGITTIRDSAFYECSSLTNVTISDSVESIGDYAFYKCSGLTDITIPNSVKRIDMSAFSDCTSLTDLTIPESVIRIEESAFRNCTSLTNLTISDSVLYIDIEKSAFEDCTKLSNLHIGNGVKTIGESAFSGCISLKSIVIPESVEQIGKYAFSGGKYGLRRVYFRGNAPIILEKAFYEIWHNSAYTEAYYPEGNSTWTSDKLLDYGSIVKWIPYSSDSSVGANPKSIPAVSSQSGSADTSSIRTVTAEYSNKKAAAYYIIAVVKDENAEDVLAADNLFYITQKLTDKSGKISVSMPISADITDYDVVIFGAENYRIGDVDLNDEIQIDDVTLLQKYIVEISMLSDDALAVADCDINGKTDIFDATLIQMYIAGYDRCGRVGEYVYDDEPTPDEPVTTEPITISPVETTEPTATAPVTTQPTTAPATTVPPTTVPVTTAPVETEPATEPTTAVSTYTMTFTNNYNWDKVYCYYWSGETNNKWPGAEMTYSYTNDFGEKVYTIEIPNTAENVIFNNGGNGQQTVDISISGSEKYYISGGSGSNCTVSKW